MNGAGYVFDTIKEHRGSYFVEYSPAKAGDYFASLDLVFTEKPKPGEIPPIMEREVLPHVPDAWVDETKTKVGYEINFNRYFYKYTPPRPLEAIEADLKKIEAEILEMMSAE